MHDNSSQGIYNKDTGDRVCVDFIVTNKDFSELLQGNSVHRLQYLFLLDNTSS